MELSRHGSYSRGRNVRLSFMRRLPPALLASVAILAGVASASSASTIAAASSARPVVSSISPKSGPAAGGTLVTIRGSHFAVAAGKTKIHFGSKTAHATCASASICVATSPKGTGTINVSVSTSGGTSTTTAAGRFVYVAPKSSGSGGCSNHDHDDVHLGAYRTSRHKRQGFDRMGRSSVGE